jgi:hypothetical protein
MAVLNGVEFFEEAQTHAAYQGDGMEGRRPMS